VIVKLNYHSNEQKNVRSNKNNLMNKEQRQQQITRLVEQSDVQHMLGTRELAELFGVAEMTIRRDLQELAESGLLQRKHGGASASRKSAKQRRRDVGIVLASRTGKYSDPFFNALLEGTDRRLQELGYRIAYINTRAELNTAAQARDLLRSSAVNGIILVGPPLGVESFEYLKQHMRALVGTVAWPELAEFDTITFDGYNGMRKMVEHLIGLGRRRLGFITGNNDFRRQGFIDAVKAQGLPTDPELCLIVPFDIDGWTPELGNKGAQQLMQLANAPDAIVCASDRIAIGAIQWLHQHGHRVPQDIAVTGFDNIPESAFTAPSLTTVHVHKQLMGQLAADRVVRRIENADEVPLLIQTPTHLVIRQSCGSEE
jgi:DNA-binding LacI/PurR family transcriptional regulator